MHFIPIIMQRCKDEGIKITREGLYFTGQKNGFLVKDEKGKIHLDEESFEKWVEERKTNIPEGYFKISELSVKLNIKLGKFYKIVRNNPDLILKKKGVKYVKEDELRKIIGRS